MLVFFKNLFYLILISTILFPANKETVMAAEYSFRGYDGALYGDLDGDGKISVTDLSVINQIVGGTIQADVKMQEYGDLNGDGRITKEDANLLSQYILGDIVEFPVEKQLDFICIEAMPQKLSYGIGDKIDTKGLVVIAWYKNGKSKTVSGYTISGSTSSPGKKMVTVSYTENGITKKDFYEIEVIGNYTITYDINGGIGTIPNQSGRDGSVVKLSKAVPVKYYKIDFYSESGEVYPSSKQVKQEFKGWSEQRNGNDNIYIPGSSYRISGNVTLYACYKSAAVGTLPIPAREGYKFCGWYTLAGRKITETTLLEETVCLYARWEKKPTEAVTSPDDKPGGEDNSSSDNKPGGAGDLFPDSKPGEAEDLFPDSKLDGAEDLFPDDKPGGTDNWFSDDGLNEEGTLFPDGGLDEEENLFLDSGLDEEEPAFPDGGLDNGETPFPDDSAEENEDRYIVEWNVSSAIMQKGKSTTAIRAYISEGDAVKAYYSSNKSIVSVDKKGKITAKKKGIAYVTVVTKQGAKDKVKIKVQSGAVKTKTLSVNKKKIILKKGRSYQIKVKLKPITASEKVIFYSSNSKIAKVSKNGKITAKKKGTAVILVKSGKRVEKIKVTVKK